MSIKRTDPTTIDSIEKMQMEIDKVYFDIDRGILKMLVATMISNRMSFDPVWLMVVAPSSGGKTEMLSMFDDLDFTHGISDLTINTFASGMQRTGKETSLLLKLNNGMMVFKDFTSILSKNQEARKEIMKQLREIYDGKYDKHTGTGESISWEGKVGAMAGSTEAIYKFNEDMSIMGDRFIMYNMTQPDRIGMAERAMENTYGMADHRAHLKDCATYFVTKILETVEDEEVELSEDMKQKIIAVANFATIARSGVQTDFKSGLVEFTPKPEMPTRVIIQLVAIASGFVAVNKANPVLGKTHPAHKGELTKDEELLLFKTAFDSIPRTRRDAIYHMAKWQEGMSSAGLATTLNLPTPSVTKYLSHINALGVCSRHKESGGQQGDTWKINEKYRDTICMVEELSIHPGKLEAPKGFMGIEEDDSGWEDWEKEGTDPLAPSE